MGVGASCAPACPGTALRCLGALGRQLPLPWGRGGVRLPSGLGELRFNWVSSAVRVLCGLCVGKCLGHFLQNAVLRLFQV